MKTPTYAAAAEAAAAVDAFFAERSHRGADRALAGDALAAPARRCTSGAEPVAGNRPVSVSPTRLGGTRHLSAAQFVHDQQGSLALVASQDGRFTLFAWSPCEMRVHAHRVETLLL